MKNHFARRQFLRTASASLFTGGLMQSETSGAQSSFQGGEAIKLARLFSGCCAYTYRHAFASGALTLESFIQRAVDLRLDGIDMTVYYMRSTDPGYIENLRYLGYKNGVPFSGAACGASMVQTDAAKRAAVLVDIKKWIDVTERLGASHLRVFAGKLPVGVSMTDSITWVVDGMKAASDYSSKKGIVLGLEDHDGVSQTADVCLEIMHRVNSKYVGINIDISHFVPTKEQDSYAQIAACIPYATHTHIRNTFDDGSPIDLDRVWRMFAASGYKGYMSYEGEEKSLTGIPAQIAEIQRLCKKYSTI